MSTHTLPLALLRIAMGWLFFYAGITKILNPEWSANGYLVGAKTFPAFYQWLTQPEILPIINFANKWGLLLIGIALILGIGVRIAAGAGMLLMILYYFPVLTFPTIGKNSYIIDEHIIYALALWLLTAAHSGRVWSLYPWCAKLPLCARWPFLHKLLQ